MLGIVAKAHMVEFHVARNIGGLRLRLLGRLFGGFKEFEDAFRRRGHLLQHVCDLGELRDGLREVLHILDERLDVAYRDATLHGENRARNGHRHVP